MPPPKAKRSRQTREETGVARDESEPTSSRRTRSTRAAAATTGDDSMDTSVIVAQSPPEAAESSGTRRIQTRSTRGRARSSVDGSLQDNSQSARTRPYPSENATAATQTDGPANAPDTGDTTSSNRPHSSRRSASLDSFDSDPEWFSMDAPAPRRRGVIQRPRPQATAQPTTVNPPVRVVSAERAAELERRRLLHERNRAEREARTAAAARGDVDIMGLMDEIASNFTPNFFDQLMDEAREGGVATAPRTFRFERDATNGRLNLVRNTEGPAAARTTSSSTTDDATGGEFAPVSAAAAMARAVAGNAPPGTVTTVRLDLQIDVVGLGERTAARGEGGAAGDARDAADPLLFDGEQRRRVERNQSIEDVARIRLDELTAPQVRRILSQVMQEGEDAMVIRRRNREERHQRAARAAWAAAAEQTVTNGEDSAATAAAAERNMLATLDEFEAAVDALPMEAAPRVAASLNTLYPLMRERRSTRINRVAAAAAAAAEAANDDPIGVASAPASPGDSASSSTLRLSDLTEAERSRAERVAAELSPGNPIFSLFSPSSRSSPFGPASRTSTTTLIPSEDALQILAAVRASLLREMRQARRERDAAAAGPPVTPPAAAAAAAMTTLRPLRNFYDETDEEPFRMLTPAMITGREFAFAPPAFEDDAITARRLTDFVAYIAGQANDGITRRSLSREFTVRGQGIDARIRSMIDACNAAAAGINLLENMDSVLLALLRSIVANVNVLDRDTGETRNGRRRIITFHMRPVTGAPGTTLRTVFGDMMASEGRGEADPSEQRLREQEDAEEAEDSTFSSAEWGECRICMADEPSNPMGCKHCRQLVGCNKCCNRWHRAGRRPTSSIIDSLFASFRADRERYDRIDEQRRVAMSGGERAERATAAAAAAAAAAAGTATPPTLAASAAAASVAAGAGAGDAPPARASSIGSALRSSMLAEAWESNCPLCRKAWRSKPNVVPMQRCRPLGEPLDEEDRGEAAVAESGEGVVQL